MDNNLSIQSVLNRLKDDLVKKNDKKFDTMDKYQLGMFLMNEYVKSPKSELWKEISYVQFNYCIILDVLPAWITDSFIMQVVENIFCY